MHIADHLNFLEEHLLDPAVRRDSKAVVSYLTDDFLEFGASGRAFDKAAILEDLAKESQDEPFTSSTVVTSKRLFIAKRLLPKQSPLLRLLNWPSRIRPVTFPRSNRNTQIIRQL